MRLAWALLLFLSACSSARYSPNYPIPNKRMGLIDRLTTKQAIPVQNRIEVSEVKPAAIAKKAKPVRKSRLPVEPKVVARVLPKQTISKAGFRWPLNLVQVTSHFGKRGREFHEGIDLRAQNGTPVYAANDGVVLYAESRIRGYGNMIVIRHPGKLNTIYAHNSKVLVSRGEKVSRGQQIAVSGSTGHVSGPHLHFEIRKGVSALNPLKLLPKG